MLNDKREKIERSLTEWAKTYGLQIRDLNATIDVNTILFLNTKTPLVVDKEIDTTVSKTTIDLPDLGLSSDEEDYKPRGIKVILTPVQDGETDIAHYTDSVAYIDEKLYIKPNKEFVTRFLRDDTMRIVPAVPDDMDSIVVSFEYNWENINQFPDAYLTVFVFAARLVLIEELMNSSLFQSNMDRTFQDSQSDTDNHLRTLKELFDRSEKLFIFEVNRVNRVYNNYR